MRRPTPSGSATRFLLGQLGWTLLVGMQVGWLEALALKRGGFSLSSAESLEFLGVFGVLGAALGLAAAGVVLPLALWGRSRGPSASWPARAAALAAAVLPSFGVLWVFVAGRINVLHLPDVLSAPSLAANAALLAGFGAAALLWAHRPWGAALDRALLVAALVVDVALGATVGVRAPREVAQQDGAARSASRGEAPDVVLILIDTLRADHLGVYGYERNTSPRIDAFAEEGVVFERAYSTTNWTRPAVASLLSSTMPSRHNVTALDRALGPDFRLLAEALRGRGYRTAFFTVGPNIEPADGYGRGVDHFFYGRTQNAVARSPFIGSILLRLVPQAVSVLPGRAHMQRSALGGDPEEVTSRALEWVREAPRERPLFMYLHYLGPHSPYRPPPPYDRAFSEVPPVERLVDPPGTWVGKGALSEADRLQMLAQYDGEILWHDEHIGHLLDGLREAGRLDRAVVAITADHGEGFGEHGFWSHNGSLFEEVVRIPLIVWSSADETLVPGRRDLPVSLLDITPTLAELAGVQGEDGFDGVSLVPRLRNAPGGGRTVFIENPVNDEIGVRTPEWAYFEGKTGDGFRRWLYRAEDRRQTEELSEQFPEVVEELSALAAARREHDRTRSAESVEVELDDERREMLEALGYIEETEPAQP